LRDIAEVQVCSECLDKADVVETVGEVVFGRRRGFGGGAL
jgi:hypothetical protein